MPILAAPLAWLAETTLMKGPVGSVLYAIGRGIKAFFKMLDWQGWLGLVASVFLAWHWYGAAADARHWEKQDSRDAKALSVVKGQRDNLQQQINSISTKKNVQHEVTTRTVTKVIEGQKQVQTVVKVIHDAPNPPDCGTPALDQLRSAV